VSSTKAIPSSGRHGRQDDSVGVCRNEYYYGVETTRSVPHSPRHLLPLLILLPNKYNSRHLAVTISLFSLGKRLEKWVLLEVKVFGQQLLWWFSLDRPRLLESDLRCRRVTPVSESVSGSGGQPRYSIASIAQPVIGSIPPRLWLNATGEVTEASCLLPFSHQILLVSPPLQTLATRAQRAVVQAPHPAKMMGPRSVLLSRRRCPCPHAQASEGTNTNWPLASTMSREENYKNEDIRTLHSQLNRWKGGSARASKVALLDPIVPHYTLPACRPDREHI
jgi:hypothetical protein